MKSIFFLIFLYGRTADYADGESGAGIVGTLIFFGFIYVIAKIWPSSKNDDNQGSYKDNNQYEEDPTEDYDEPDYIDAPIPGIDDDDFEYFPAHSSVNTRTQEDDVKSSIPEITDRMKQECIKTYGEYGEIVSIKNGGISIKEDGEYRLIDSSDWRYDILFKYIFDNRYEMYSPANKIADHDLIYEYSVMEEGNILPPAKPINEHGVLSKEYWGGHIIALKAYIWRKTSPMGGCIYSSRPIPLEDFLFSVGFDRAIYLHKYIGRPMDWMIYRLFRNMQIKGMTVEEFKKFSKTYGIITENSDGYFTQDRKFIGKKYSDVEKYMLEQMPFTYEQAQKEVKEREWHL